MGGGGKQAADASQAQLAEFMRQYQEQSDPVRQALFGQVLEALRTGGVGAQLPFVTQAVEQSRSATSQALTGLDERLARMGLAGTPYGERIRAQISQQGLQQAAAIPTNFAQMLIGQAPGLALGSGQAITSGLGQAAAVGAQREAAELGFLSSMFSTAVGSGGLGLPTGGGGG